MYTLGLHLSRAQVKKLLNKPVVRESCYYRKLTDWAKDEPAPPIIEAQLDNLLGNRALLPVSQAGLMETSESGTLIVYNGSMVDVGSMMQKLDKSEKAREEIEHKLMVQDSKIEEDSKVMQQLEQTNRTLAKELEEVKTSLNQTEESLKATEEQKDGYLSQLTKTADSLSTTMKELLATLEREKKAEMEEAEADDQKTQENGTDDPELNEAAD